MGRSGFEVSGKVDGPSSGGFVVCGEVVGVLRRGSIRFRRVRRELGRRALTDRIDGS